MSVKRILATMAAGLILASAATSYAADTYTVDPTHSSATFKIRHLMSKVSGRFSKFSGTIVLDQANPENASVDFTIDAASIDTDNDKRNAHLRSEDFFDVEKYPEMTFKSSKIEKTGESTYDVTGDFTMHGVTKTITIPVEILGFGVGGRGNPMAAFETNFKLNRKDYEVVWNRTLDTGGLLLGDEVDVNITLEAGVRGE